MSSNRNAFRQAVMQKQARFWGGDKAKWEAIADAPMTPEEAAASKKPPGRAAATKSVKADFAPAAKTTGSAAKKGIGTGGRLALGVAGGVALGAGGYALGKKMLAREQSKTAHALRGRLFESMATAPDREKLAQVFLEGEEAAGEVLRRCLP